MRFSESVLSRNAFRTSLRLSPIGLTTFYLGAHRPFISAHRAPRQAHRLIAPSPKPLTGCPIAPSPKPHRGLRAPAPLPPPGDRSRAQCARAPRAIPPRATRERIHSPVTKHAASVTKRVTLPKASSVPSAKSLVLSYYNSTRKLASCVQCNRVPRTTHGATP